MIESSYHVSGGPTTLFLLYVITGISIFFASLVLILAVWQKNWQGIGRFFLFFLFAASFELINMHGTGSYAYFESSPLMIGGLPVYIPLVWALLLFFVTQQIPAYWSVWRAGLQGGAAVLLYDLSIDVLAVHSGWWTWFLDSSQGRYGVSYGNFFGRWIVACLVCIAYQIHRRFDYPLWLLLIGALFVQTLILVVPYVIASFQNLSPDHGFPHWVMLVVFFGCLWSTWSLEHLRSGENMGTEVGSSITSNSSISQELANSQQSLLYDQSVVLVFDAVVHTFTAFFSLGLIPFGMPSFLAIGLFLFSIFRLTYHFFVWRKSHKDR